MAKAIAYLTDYEGKIYLCISDGGFQKWEVDLATLARLNFESADRIARHIRGTYIPKHTTCEPPIMGIDV